MSHAHEVAVDRAAEAIKDAAHPRIHIFLSSSDNHLMNQLRKDREEVVSMAVKSIVRAREHVDDVEFSPMGSIRTDKEFLAHLVQAAVDAGVKRFVYSASSSAYGSSDKSTQTETDPTNPISPYAVQKLVGEIYCKMLSEVYDIETVSLRYFNVYGVRQSLEGAYCLVMGIFAQQRLRGEPMTINGNGNQRRDFTYVGDVVDANIRAATSDKVGEGEVINIGNGENRSVNQLANLIGGYRTHREPVIEPFATLANNKKAKRLLGWKPTMVLEDWVVKYKKDLGLN